MVAKSPPDNLGKRQRDLNTRVNNAFASKAKFDVKDEKDASELDKFFKIDLAAKFKDVDYIIEVLKSSETLYVHRALKKSKWIYHDEYSYIINPEYLEKNIFSMTSMRVKKLILKTIVMHMRKGDRAELFYHYCMKIKLTDIALKCLLFTSEQFKLSVLQKKNKDILLKKFRFIRDIVGKSFELLEAYMKILTEDQGKTILRFRYFYTVDNIRYLNLLEEYIEDVCHDDPFYSICKLDQELCEHIMKKYKDRVISKPKFYLRTLRKDILIRSITPEEAKIIIDALWPSSAEKFWTYPFHTGHAEVFLNMIPKSETYKFLKKMFSDKYPDDDFEENANFYTHGYYEFMTSKEQEDWALSQIRSEKQVLGVGNDYKWYRFINFDVAFEEIKKYVMLTSEPGKRGSMLKTLIRSVRSDCELEILFKYYHERHANEPKQVKSEFLNEVIYNQDVFNFNETCWAEFYTLLLGMEIKTITQSKDTIDMAIIANYKNVSVFYCIVNEKTIPEALMTYLLTYFYPMTSDYNEYSVKRLLEKLDDKRCRFLFEYLHKFYTDQINDFKNKPYTRDGRSRVEKYFQIIVKLIEIFNVNEEIYAHKPKSQYKRPRCEHDDLSDTRLLLDLKLDKNLVLEKLLKIKTGFQEIQFINMNNFLKKIKIYFPNDVTESYLAMFEEHISGEYMQPMEICVGGVFKLGNEDVKVNIMEKYAPENGKINYDEDDYKVLNIRKSICRFASNSLPPVPLVNMLSYLKGDYAHFCLHIFSVYIAALPMTKCIELVQSVIDSPVSIQKHALRLAVHCFNADGLKKILTDVWKNTKNVSMRSVIYKTLYNRVLDRNESELYDIIISFTLQVHEDDQKIIFKLIDGDTLPENILGEFKKAAWKAIGQFKDKEPNIGRKTKVINSIQTHLNIMDREFVRSIIDEHLDTMFVENKLNLNYSDEEITALYVEKWNLTVKYILTGSNDQLVQNIELTQHVVQNCLKMWNERCSGDYIYQHCCWEFIESLIEKSIEYRTGPEYLISIIEGTLDLVQKSLPLHEIYLPKWEMQLVVCSRQIMKNLNTPGNNNNEEIVEKSVINFGNEVGKLVSEYVHNKIYFISLSEKVKELIIKRVQELLEVIYLSSDNNANEYFTDALTILAATLVEFETMETLLLAVHILPEEISNELSRDKYQMVLDAVTRCSNPEIQSAAHQKLHKPFKRTPSKAMGKDARPILSNKEYVQLRSQRRRNRR